MLGLILIEIVKIFAHYKIGLNLQVHFGNFQVSLKE